MIRRRTATAAFGGAFAAPAPAQTGAFPDRPVRLIVPLAPGGPTDAHGRVLAEIAGRALGQPVVVENRPGASATLGARMLAGTRGPTATWSGCCPPRSSACRRCSAAPPTIRCGTSPTSST